MIIFDNMIHNAQFEYFKYLQNHGIPEVQSITSNQRGEDTFEYVWSSSLGWCPLKAALKRKNAPTKFPTTDDPGSLHRMYAGKAIEFEMVAAPMKYYMAKNYPDNELAVSCKVRDEELKISGEIDILVKDDNTIHIGEVKSITYEKLRHKHFFHLYSYMHINKYDNYEARGYIIAVNFTQTEIFELKSVDGGYVFVDSNGSRCRYTWNNPETLNHEKFVEEVTKHHDYLSGIEKRSPIPDPVNVADSFQCIRWEKKPKNGEDGIAWPNCAYSCHFNENTPTIVKKDINGRYLLYSVDF